MAATHASPPTSQTHNASINDLPLELWGQIVKYLDAPCPSTARLRQQPVFEVTQSNVTALKSVSCVSPTLRAVALRVLFRHARLMVPGASEVANCTELAAFLDFVLRHDLTTAIKSLTLLSNGGDGPHHQVREDSPKGWYDYWATLLDVVDPLCITIVAPPPVLASMASCSICTNWMQDFHMPCHVLSLNRSPTESASE